VFETSWIAVGLGRFVSTISREVQQRVNDPKFPNETPMKRDKSIYPDKEDRLPKKDRIPSEIRNDDNSADVDI